MLYTDIGFKLSFERVFTVVGKTSIIKCQSFHQFIFYINKVHQFHNFGPYNYISVKQGNNNYYYFTRQ